MTTTARARFQPQIFLLALAMIVLEISYTRIFSFKLVYYFTYLVIGLALLGLGAGGVAVSLSQRLRAWATERLITMAAVATAAAILAGYLAIASVQLNAFDMVQAAVNGNGAVAGYQGAKLVALAFLLALPFFSAGVGITAILATQPAHANRLYFADLVGAALGCAISVPLMATISPPGCVMLAGAFAAAAAWPGLRSGGRVPVGLGAAVLLMLAVRPGLLPDPVVDRVKTLAPKDPPHQVIFSRWNPVFRVDVLEPTAEFLKGQSFKMLVHDGMWGSIMRGGDEASLAFYDRDARMLPFTVLPPGPRVVVIGAAGGAEIQASLHYDAGHVVGVELNPVTVGLLTDRFADFTGRLAAHPRVTLVCAEGRTWLMRSPEPVDLVWFVAPDSYAAMNAATSGAFVLSESYLYTVEMIVESLNRLAAGGIAAIQFGEFDFAEKPNRTIRYLVTAREALRRLGISTPGRHVLVATTSGFGLTSSTILVKREPFTEAEAVRFAEVARGLDGGVVRWAPPDTPPGFVATVLGADDATLAAWRANWPFDVSAVHDDAPFFWHFVPFRTALTSSPRGSGALEHGLGEQLLMALLVCAALLATLFLAAPLVVRWSHWRSMPGKLAAGVYFAALGLGFMFFEIPLIQHLTLFLGYPTYSLTVTLCGLLLSTAVGALLGERVRMTETRLLLVLLLCLSALVVVYWLALPPIIARWIVADLPVRIAIALAMLAPLGLCLGMLMPLGLRRVGALGDGGPEYVAWAWAVNGFFSVISSLLATILAMSVGFDAVLLIALAVYSIGVAAFLAIPQPAQAGEQGRGARPAGRDTPTHPLIP